MEIEFIFEINVSSCDSNQLIVFLQQLGPGNHESGLTCQNESQFAGPTYVCGKLICARDGLTTNM
jgi:hypothetical protein